MIVILTNVDDLESKERLPGVVGLGDNVGFSADGFVVDIPEDSEGANVEVGDNVGVVVYTGQLPLVIETSSMAKSPV